MLDFQSELRGSLPGGFGERPREVESRDARAGGGSALGDGSRAASAIEPAVAWFRRQRSMTRSWMSAIVSVIRWYGPMPHVPRADFDSLVRGRQAAAATMS